MFTRRHVLIVGLILMVCLPLAATRQEDQDTVLVLTGTVEITTAPDGTATVVMVDVQTDSSPADGLIEHTFRLQHRSISPAAYRGPARVAFKRNRLSVEIQGQPGFVFGVAGQDPAPSGGALNCTYYLADGLSHFWGQSARRSPADVVASLLKNGCSSDPDSPNCDHCDAGGVGQFWCDARCEGGGECSASCGGGFYACCNCPEACRCCPNPPGVR